MMRKTLGMAMLVVGMFFAVAGCDSKTLGDSKDSTGQPQQPGTGGGAGLKEMTLDLGNGVSMKLVEIPAGTFTMGSPKDEKDRGDDEGLPPGQWENGSPQLEVTISKPFYMGITHVTEDQYALFVKDTGQPHESPTRPSGDHPVVNVSWVDASGFCKWLSKKTGKTVALPTEAQWEYACRAGSKTRFSFGDKDSDLGDYAWYYENSGGMTHPVGQKKPNAWGLYDMHGSAWQWCSDYYGPYAAADKTDPMGPKEGISRGGQLSMPSHSLRVLRGGSRCIDTPRLCRSASRTRYDPDYKGGDIIIDYSGFRVAVVALGVDLP